MRDASTGVRMVFLVLLAACAGPPTAPPGSVPVAKGLAVGIAGTGADVEKTREEQTYSGEAITCDGEPVAVEVRVVSHERLVFTPSGRLQRARHVLVQARGTGLISGVRFIGQVHEILVASYGQLGDEPEATGDVTPAALAPPVGIVMRIRRVHEVTQGPAENNDVMLHLKLTVNGNGVVTVEFFKSDYGCGRLLR